jgi:hypothetical protein
MAVVVVSATAVLLAPAIWRHRSLNSADAGGQILSTSTGEEPGGPVRVEGELSSVPQTYHVWLALETDGLLLPLEPEIAAREGRFAVEIETVPIRPAQSTSLALILVDPKGQRAIEYWLLQGSLGQGFPGFDRIPGARALDRVAAHRPT